MVITDLSADPTYPRDNNHPCPKCGYEGLYFFYRKHLLIINFNGN